MQVATITRLVLLVFVTAILGACASGSQVVQPQRRFFWPPEPDEPRIEWIEVYYGDLEIKEKGLMTSIVGDNDTVNFRRPISVAGNGEGVFVVADQELGQVFLFDLNKHEAFPLGGDRDAAGISQPSGVSVDGDGVFYVADAQSRKVYVVTADNRIVRVLDLSKQAKSIGLLSVDRARKRLLIPDSNGKQVLVYALTGELLATIDGKDHFSTPNAVASESDGTIVIADTFNASVVRFSPEGKYLSTIGKRGDSPGDLSLAAGVAVDSENHIYVADARLNRITVFGNDGAVLMVLGGGYSVQSGKIGRGGFLLPQGISIDKNDRIYVGDSMNKRIQVFQYLNAKYLREHPLVPGKP